MSVLRNERLNLRLDSEAKHRLEAAAAFEGKTVSNFVLASALTHADETIEKHQSMRLGRRDAEIFLQAILDPPAPNRKLLEALERHGTSVVSR